ncbi:MAG: hypothetical protein Q8P82_02090 [bacterium]|nr:hypothetical protein [bacterium]
MHPDMMPHTSEPSAEMPPVQAWLESELFTMKGRRETITGDTVVQLNPMEAAALRSHFAMRFGDAPFEDHWASSGMTVKEAALAMQEKMNKRKPPAETLH